MPIQIGPCRVTREIGRGGMGVVYLARDTKLDRDVAIKALPDELVSDADCLTRFEREAKTLAALNHPNIASIHGLEEVDGRQYLILEYVEGDTLDECLRNGPLTMPDALEIGRQIAEAVEAAHARDIVHRDLKPANVKVRRAADAWEVKVLDFGLAKACPDAVATASEIAESPTVVRSPTIPGMIIGTAGYLSPEQARGRLVDRRSDVFAFGCILYELLVGTAVFGGETVSDCVGAALHKEPDFSTLPSNTPATVRLLMRRCLTKERRQRLQAIGDARIALEEAVRGETWLDAPPAPPSVRNAVIPWIVCGVLSVVLTGILLIDRGDQSPSETSSMTLSVITCPRDTSINWRGTKDTWSKIGFSQLVAVSRDGRRIVYTRQSGGETSLYLKTETDYAPRAMPGTEGARGAFFSPDGNWIGFMVESKVWKVRLPDGAPQLVCPVNSAAFDATWLDDETIVFSTDHGLRRIPEKGGDIEELTRVDIDGGERGHCFPHAIPGTDLIVFTLATDSGQDAAVLSLHDRTQRVIKPNAMGARYSGTGHLVFARGDQLLATSYDPRTNPELVGRDETRIAANVHASPGQGGALVHLFATSQSGTLIYTPQAPLPQPDSLVWVDIEDGSETLIVEAEGSWMHQRLQPNGDDILFNRLTSDGMLDLWIYDEQRSQINPPLTRIGHVYDAEWSIDGLSVGFMSLDRHGRSTNIIRANRSQPAERIFKGADDSRPHLCQWSPAGPTLVYFDRSSAGGILSSSLDDGKWQPPELVMNTSRHEAWAQISPDGQLIAFVGFEPEGREVYVQDYPRRTMLVRVSDDHGGEPRWAHDSRTLYFREAGKIYRATITTQPTLERGETEELQIDDTYDAAASGHQHYDISHDGKRFLMVKHGERFYPNIIHVIEHWADNLDNASSP